MSKKIDERLPKDTGKKVRESYAAIRSPWDKLISYKDAMHYVSRYNSVLSAACMQALRILVPDYKERAQYMCEAAYQRLYYIQTNYGAYAMDQHNVHPFCRGSFVGALTGDAGDEGLLMCGRVQDFGTYRAEKELDVCDWDIVGSELCRATTQSLEASSTAWSEKLRPGTKLEFHMVEARGCGDRHCRIVAESRDKYPMPAHEQWECFGPVATEDQIKYTQEEDTVKESMVFREECDYTFSNGTNMEQDDSSVSEMMSHSNAACLYIFPTIDYLLRQGKLEEKTVDHVLRCVCEAAGKAAFGEYYAKEAQRAWLGAPAGLEDGRLMGGHIEMFLQAFGVPYETEAFNSEEVIYVIDRGKLTCHAAKMGDAYVAYWYGMTRTLVNAQWFLWEEKEKVSEDKLRIKIARKIDQFC